MDGKQNGHVHQLASLVPALMITLTLLSGCYRPLGPPLTESEVVGQYRLEQVTGVDELTVRPDGTYQEVVTFNKAETSGFIPGEVYRYSGRWTYSMVDGEAQVVLEKALVDIPIQPDNPPHLHDWRLWAYRHPQEGMVLDVPPDDGDPDGTLVFHKVSDDWDGHSSSRANGAAIVIQCNSHCIGSILAARSACRPSRWTSLPISRARISPTTMQMLWAA